MPPAEPRFLRISEAAKIAKISERMLYSYVRANIGPKYIRFGRNVRLPYKQFLAWLETDHPSPPKGY